VASGLEAGQDRVLVRGRVIQGDEEDHGIRRSRPHRVLRLGVSGRSGAENLALGQVKGRVEGRKLETLYAPPDRLIDVLGAGEIQQQFQRSRC
jgi:hypothetical protein